MNTPDCRKLLLGLTKAIWLLLAFFSCPGAWATTNKVVRTSVYSDDQLEIINHDLEKWGGSDKHTVVKDILKHEARWHLADVDLWGQVPNSFKNEAEARKAGCQCD